MIVHDPKNRKLITINISSDSDFHTQINNKKIPYRSCGSTSSIMALKNTRIPIDTPLDEQEEDYLTGLLLSDEAHEVMKKIAPWAVKSKTPANEVHVMIDWGVNKIISDKRFKMFFDENSNIKKLAYDTLERKSSVVSGKFTSYGHMTCFSGFTTYQDNIREIKTHKDINVELIKDIIIDDPYGNYFTGYKDHHGNNVYFPIDIFLALVSRGEEKNIWAHRFKIL